MRVKFSELLKGTRSKAEKDGRIFNSWVKGKIEIRDCLKLFLINNGWNENEYINYGINCVEFEKWLNSLGYFREDEENEIKILH